MLPRSLDNRVSGVATARAFAAMTIRRGRRKGASLTSGPTPPVLRLPRKRGPGVPILKVKLVEKVGRQLSYSGASLVDKSRCRLRSPTTSAVRLVLTQVLTSREPWLGDNPEMAQRWDGRCVARTRDLLLVRAAKAGTLGAGRDSSMRFSLLARLKSPSLPTATDHGVITREDPPSGYSYSSHISRRISVRARVHRESVSPADLMRRARSVFESAR